MKFLILMLAATLVGCGPSPSEQQITYLSHQIDVRDANRKSMQQQLDSMTASLNLSTDTMIWLADCVRQTHEKRVTLRCDSRSLEILKRNYALELENKAESSVSGADPWRDVTK